MTNALAESWLLSFNSSVYQRTLNRLGIPTWLLLSLVALCLLPSQLAAQSLRGSAASVEKQNRIAVSYGLAFMESGRALDRLVNNGQLTRISATRHLELHDVSFPYAQTGVKLFLDRLSAQYFNSCREKLVVTSLVRPLDRQPANAAANSVHPTGMAVDLRVPGTRRCRTWLENTLLGLEAADVLDVTRERNPPHYHVAVYVAAYQSYVAGLNGAASDYTVRRGDTLSGIARQFGLSVAQLRNANGIAGDLINVGQKLQIPASGSRPTPAGVQTAAVTQVTHKVQPGDTLWRIGNRYGTSVTQIRNDNGLKGDTLQIGQELRISSFSR